MHHGKTASGEEALFVFCTGTRTHVPWLKRAARRVSAGKLPPVPAPFYLATGRITIVQPKLPER